jgi:hypothetical protein
VRRSRPVRSTRLHTSNQIKNFFCNFALQTQRQRMQNMSKEDLLRMTLQKLNSTNAPIYALFLINSQPAMKRSWQQHQESFIQRAQQIKARGQGPPNCSSEQLAHVQFLIGRAESSPEECLLIMNHIQNSDNELRKQQGNPQVQASFSSIRQQHAEFSPAPTKPDVMLSDQPGPSQHHNWADPGVQKVTFSHVAESRPMQQTRGDYPSSGTGYLGAPLQISSNHTVNTTRIRELLKQIDPDEQMEPEVEEVWHSCFPWLLHSVVRGNGS